MGVTPAPPGRGYRVAEARAGHTLGLMTAPSHTPTGLLDREPVLVFLSGLAGLVDLGIIAGNALDWLQLDEGQTVAVVAFVTAVTALIAGVLRASVYSPATVARIEQGL